MFTVVPLKKLEGTLDLRPLSLVWADMASGKGRQRASGEMGALALDLMGSEHVRKETLCFIVKVCGSRILSNILQCDARCVIYVIIYITSRC